MRLRDIKIGGWYKVVDAFGGTQKAEVIGLLPGEPLPESSLCDC